MLSEEKQNEESLWSSLIESIHVYNARFSKVCAVGGGGASTSASVQQYAGAHERQREGGLR